MQNNLTTRNHIEDLYAVDLGCCLIHWVDTWVWAADKTVDDVVFDFCPLGQVHFILLQPMQTHLSSYHKTPTTSHYQDYSKSNVICNRKYLQPLATYIIYIATYIIALYRFIHDLTSLRKYDIWLIKLMKFESISI